MASAAVGAPWSKDAAEAVEEDDPALVALIFSMVREREGERLTSRLPSPCEIVACDVHGTGMSSEAFAAWLQEKREVARDIAFAIGGAYGLSEGVRSRARLRLSLAPWTLPHELARLVLAEQLYRAGTIVRGEPYHK